MIYATVILAAFCTAGYADGANQDRISKLLHDHIVVKTTEKLDSNEAGDVTQVTTTEYSKTAMSQRVVEQKKRDKEGVLRVTSLTRTTEITDTAGGRSTITEKLVREGGDLVVDQTTDCQQTPARNITTVKRRNKDGNLVPVSRTTVSMDADGIKTVMVERPDKKGVLCVRQITTECLASAK
jgi:hypothetical protein